MKTVLSIAATGLLLSSAAVFAQTPPHPITGVPAQTAANSTTKADDLRQQMKADLEKAGFTDVTLRPELIPGAGEGQVRQSSNDDDHPELADRDG